MRDSNGIVTSALIVLALAHMLPSADAAKSGRLTQEPCLGNLEKFSTLTQYAKIGD